MSHKSTDVLIIGGGAAGLMCAITAGENGRRVTLIEHNDKVAGKILISGGGRCNFTNLEVSATNYQSENEHFCKSALSRFTSADFIERVKHHNITYHEKTLGQLFCDNRATDIIDMLLAECHQHEVEILTGCRVTAIDKTEHFLAQTSNGTIEAESLVIATGGLSIPKMGATSFGYDIAKQFGHSVIRTHPALAPFTLTAKDKARFADLSGVSTKATVSCNGMCFTEALLFTHRGLSGPVVLQTNSYWRKGDRLHIDLLPGLALTELVDEWKDQQPKSSLRKALSALLPKRLIAVLIDNALLELSVNQLSRENIEQLVDILHHCTLIPAGDEGYAKAEVTRGGINTDELSSKTMESKLVPKLYFIGEVVDVTGWLGGYNFQWAWASGYCAGQYA